MEIFYCSECRSRVSSVDIDQGRGRPTDGGVLCEACVRKLGLPPGASASRAASREAGLQPAGAEGRTTRRRMAPAAAGPGKPPVAVFVLGAGVIILLAVIAVILARRDRLPEKAGSQPTVYTSPSEDLVPVPAVPPVSPEPTPPRLQATAAEGEGWVGMIEGANLAEAGWKHDIPDDKFVEGFTAGAGVLELQQVAGECRVKKQIPFTGGEIRFTVDSRGSYWEFRVIDVRDDVNCLAIGLDGSVGGRHRFRVTIQGTEAQVFIDDRPLADVKGAKLERPLQKPIYRMSYIRFTAQAKVRLRITDMKYRKTAE